MTRGNRAHSALGFLGVNRMITTLTAVALAFFLWGWASASRRTGVEHWETYVDSLTTCYKHDTSPAIVCVQHPKISPPDSVPFRRRSS